VSGDWTERKLARGLAIAASAVVASTVVAAIWTMGSPASQRLVKLDQRRVQDLQRIEMLLGSHHRNHGALPPDLATLARQPGQRLAIADPVDGAPYTYRIVDKDRFRLCAVFGTDTATARPGEEAWAADDWHHGAGRQCFERKQEHTP